MLLFILEDIKNIVYLIIILVKHLILVKKKILLRQIKKYSLIS